jgi:hypothetical protein
MTTKKPATPTRRGRPKIDDASRLVDLPVRVSLSLLRRLQEGAAGGNFSEFVRETLERGLLRKP